jgi:HK97 family phage portal protein
MNFFNWIVPAKIKRQFASAIYEYWITQGTANTMEDDTGVFLSDAYKGNISVYSIIDRIDKMRRQAPMRLYQKKDGKAIEVTDHELNRFLSKVNPETGFNDFVSQVLIYRLICGENFIYAPRLNSGLNAGKAAELRVLPASDVEIIEGTPLDPVRGYRMENSTISQEFPKADVIHQKLFDPLWYRNNTLHGMSPIVAANKTVSRLNEADITQLKQLENQGPKYALFKKTTGTQQGISQRLSAEQQDDISQKIKTASKSSNRGLPLVLKEEFGKLDLGTNLADMALTDLTEAGVVALCSVYGMPPELFGYGQKTYNNMGTARKSAWTDCVMPNMDSVADLMNEAIIWGSKYADQGYFFKMDYSEVEELQDGMKSKIEWMNAAGLPMNDVFEAAGYSRVDNPRMDEPRVPSMTMFLSDFDLPPDIEKSYEDYLKVK